MQCLYLFGPPKPKPFGLSFLKRRAPCKHNGFPGSYIKVLASFGLAAEMIQILRKAVQASKKKPKIELSHILKATKSVALALVAFNGP